MPKQLEMPTAAVRRLPCAVSHDAVAWWVRHGFALQRHTIKHGGESSSNLDVECSEVSDETSQKVIVAGSRSIDYDKPVAEAILEAPFDIGELVSGGAKGVDSIAENLFKSHNNGLYTDDKTPIKRFEPDWGKHGKKAGPIRNREMGEYADALIAVWDGESKGTRNMISQALELNLDVYVKVVSDER